MSESKNEIIKCATCETTFEYEPFIMNGVEWPHFKPELCDECGEKAVKEDEERKLLEV